MPVTRKSSRSSPGAGKQSTLSFKHKVTKAIKTGKEGYKSPSRAKEYIPEPSPEPSKQKRETEPEEDVPSTDADNDEQQRDDKVGRTEQEHVQRSPVAAQEKTEAELKAEKISDAAIERYWAGIEAGRMAKAVHKKHTEDLTTGEKVLRYFDVSSQYGVRLFRLHSLSITLLFTFPCVGQV